MMYTLLQFGLVCKTDRTGLYGNKKMKHMLIENPVALHLPVVDLEEGS